MSDDALRKANHKKLTAILTQVKAHPGTPISYNMALTLTERTQEIMEKTEVVQLRLWNTATDDSARTVQESAFSPVEATYVELRCALRDLIDSLPKPTSTPGPTNVKLPTIELPNFDGNYTAWSSFKDLFVASVDKNPLLADSQRLQYLKSSLQGDPANLIRNMFITDANYAEAWKILDERYSNEREIVTSLTNNIVHLKPVHSENPQALQSLIDSADEHTRALRVLGQPVDQWDTLLISILVSKVDASTRKEWAMRQTTTAVPTLKEFKDFISCHVRGLMATTATSHTTEKKKEKHVRAHHSTSEPTCQICQQPHPHFKCKTLANSSISERVALVKSHHLCFNFLSKGHGKNQCSSKRTCQKCGKKHHTLLHDDQPQQRQGGGNSSQQQPASQGSSNQQQPQSTVTSHHAAADSQVLLTTAVVHVKDVRGQFQPVRIFLDPGSQATIISEECVSRLGHTRQLSNLRVSGVGDTDAGKARGKLQITLYSTFNKESSFQIEAHIFQKITGDLPKYLCQKSNWSYLVGLQLADPQWYKPSKVDILIGAEYYTKMLVKQSSSGSPTLVTSPYPDRGPDAQETIFGWVLSGLVPVAGSHQVRCFHTSNEDDVSDIMKRFWEVEQPPQTQLLSKEEQQCEAHFSTTTTRDMNGRFIVSVPFNSKKEELGFSRVTAARRLQQVERRLNNNPSMSTQYVDFMREYQQLGHLQKIPPSELKEVPGRTFYLPHHCVVNQSSTTTKLRVVFDGSAKTTTGVSLNDAMLVGPTVQDDLYDQLIRFRLFPVVLKADITKMYRQFQLVPADADFHRIVWRESPNQEIEDYRLVTVTYGTACAPYLATRCLKQLGMDVESRYPLASIALTQHHYVDDLMSGSQDDGTAITLYKQLTSAVSEAQLELRKWSSNSQVVLQTIPEEQRELNPHEFDPDKTVKALGVQWNPAGDTFTFKYIQLPISHTLTKRQILSDLAKVFDPLGLISPIILRAKIILQELWKLTLDWDHPVPEHVQQQWEEYQEDLKEIPRIIIPRCILPSSETPTDDNVYDLHGFSDASEVAYGVAIYLRTTTPEGNITVRLLTSKTKVAPLQQVPLPRLELMAAVLLAELVDHLHQKLDITFTVHLWSDSTITLRWIASQPRRWKTFVANRVARIQECTTVASWRHVPGVDNPADLASRGVPVAQLINSSFWWNGPAWLSEPQFPMFYDNADNSQQAPPSALEERKLPELSHPVILDESLIERFSSLTRMKRVTAYLFRFLHNAKPANRQSRRLQPLTPAELHDAFQLCIRLSQSTHFSDELKSLAKIGKVSASSKLSPLNPYVDSNGILRVSGRLQKSNLPEGRKHQIILPGNIHLVTLLIRHHHLQQLHSGFQLTWSAVQSEFWITKGRDIVRHLVRSCVTCRRFRGKAAQQLMGQLPSSRVTPTSRPFLHTGVDYAGPFFLKNPVGRAPKIFKGYMCVFVCMVTKAIHLEPVSSLSTDAFLATFRRFVSRRGLCAHLYSDRGTNFIGADKELSKLVKSTSWNTNINDNLSSNGIQWHFNEPFSPHQGGLWEAGVKSAKFHLRRVIGNANMTFEQFNTILCQIEAILNSRPLYQSSSDPTDFLALTPGHFIIGEPLTAVPDVNLIPVQTNRLDIFQQQQQRIQHFWQRWSREYLNTLQQRNKWKVERDNMQPGDLVLIIEDNLPPGKWEMGRVVKGHQDPNGHVRKVTVQTATSTIDRHICKLVILLKCDTINPN